MCRNDCNYQNIEINDDLNGAEILWIMRRTLGLSNHKISSVKFDPRGILLDGKRANVRTRAAKGQVLQIKMDDSIHKENDIVPVKMPLQILYEDKDYLILDKPSGQVCHPSRGHYADTLANGVCAYLSEKGEPCHIHIVGRLDKDTSGIVVFAKNSVAAQKYISARDQGLIQKEYYCMVQGMMDEKEGTIDIPMEEYFDPEKQALLMRRADKGKAMAACTHYQVLKTIDGSTHLRVSIQTGRTHQIRFHMAAIGHPILGDSLYGNSASAARLALHAMAVHVIKREE